MYKIKHIIWGCFFCWIFLCSVQILNAKENYIYERGRLLDINSERRTNTSYHTYNSPGTTVFRGGNVSQSSPGSFHTYPVTVSALAYNISVRVKDIVYAGRYVAKWRWSYDPDWVIGDPIEVRFNENKTKMYLKKPNGSELKTEIVKKIRQ